MIQFARSKVNVAVPAPWYEEAERREPVKEIARCLKSVPPRNYMGRHVSAENLRRGVRVRHKIKCL